MSYRVAEVWILVIRYLDEKMSQLNLYQNRFMKYATAVYGDAMIRAAELELEDRFDARLLDTPSQERVRQHCRLKETDEIVSFDIDYDGDVSQCTGTQGLWQSV
jgi:transposase